MRAVAANATQCEDMQCTQYCACDTTWAWVGGVSCGFVAGIFFTLAAFGASILILWLVNYRRGALIERIRSKLASGLEESASYESLGGLESDLDPPRFSIDDDFGAKGLVSSAVRSPPLLFFSSPSLSLLSHVSSCHRSCRPPSLSLRTHCLSLVTPHISLKYSHSHSVSLLSTQCHSVFWKRSSLVAT